VGLVVGLLVLGWAPGLGAQIDPEPRFNLELGVEGPLRGDGATSGYAFILWNRPHFIEEDWYWRIIFAPLYLQSELVRDRWPAPGHAIGIGVGGGFFPYDFDEYRAGSLLERESFWGHGGELALSYYRRLRIADVLPVEGQLRVRPQYVVYQRSGDTEDRFALPTDTAIYSGRVGVRVGGEPPELLPEVALEASAWYEVSYRVHADAYGLPEAPVLPEHTTHLAWGRIGGIVRLGPTTARVFLTGGTALRTDALSTFRLGSALPFRREFPLVLRGYYVDEIFATDFVLLNVAYRFPVWPGSDRVKLQLAFDFARVEYLAGHELPRRSLRGLGVDLAIAITKSMTLQVGYGYGWDAPRNDGFGGHELNALLEFKY
jgi:hypothetical protein